jgi:hypothetical protein
MNKFCRDILLFLLALFLDVLKQEKISPNILKNMFRKCSMYFTSVFIWLPMKQI